MCTVSYLPVAGGYLLTSNRDEDPGRKTEAPAWHQLNSKYRVLAPSDKEKGGTWIAIDENGRAVCLMNGAFERHHREPPYRRSRGHFVFEALESPVYSSFTRDVELGGIEPFTLLMLSPGYLGKFIWDGQRKYYWELPAGSIHLWSSPTLYTSRQHADKERYFKDFLSGGTLSAEEVLKMHGRERATPFILKLPEVGTVSISQLRYTDSGASLTYHNKEKYNDEAWHSSTYNF